MDPHLVYPGYSTPRTAEMPYNYMGPPLYHTGVYPRPYFQNTYPPSGIPMTPRFVPTMMPAMPVPYMPSPHQYHPAQPLVSQPYPQVPQPYQQVQHYPQVQTFRVPQPMVPIPNMYRGPPMSPGHLVPVGNPLPVHTQLPSPVSGTYTYPYMAPTDTNLYRPMITHDSQTNGYTYGDMLIRGYVGSFDASGREGILTKTGSGVEARFGKDDIYIGGNKVSTNQNLWEVINKETNLRAIIRTIGKPNSVGPFHSFNQAMVVWFGEMPTIEHIMSGLIVEMEDKSVSPEKESKSSSKSKDVSSMTAYIWWADASQGVLRIYEEQGWGTEFSGIYFKSSALSINGQRVKSCNSLHLLVANFNKCKVTAHKRLPARTICGITVCWEATLVECGPAPESLKKFINETSNFVKESLNNNIDNDVFKENSQDSYENSIDSDDTESEVDDESTNLKKNCDSLENLNDADDNETILNGEQLNEKLSLSDCMLVRGCIEGFNKSGNAGYINCHTKTESMIVWFSQENVYMGGKKVDTNISLNKILSVGINVKAVISESNSPGRFENSKSNNAEAKYLSEARIVWLGEVPNENIVIPRNLQLKEGIDNIQENKSLSPNSDISDMIAYVWWANSDQGILRLYEEKGWGNKFTGILFSIDSIHINGFQVSNCQDLYKLVAHFNKCKVKAGKILPMTMYGMTVTWEAIIVECDNPTDIIKPLVTKAIKRYKKQHKKTKGKNIAVESSGASISEKKLRASPISDSYLENSTLQIKLEEENVNEPLQKVFETDNDTIHQSNIMDQETNSKSENSRPPSQESASSHESWIDDVEVLIKGKYITGLIIKVLKDVGVAQWKSMEYGEVYISFSPENIYIDNTPLLYKLNNQNGIYTRRCNFYVIPCEPMYLEGMTINLKSTCGWMGSKPSYIPSPGEQPLSKISLANLKICKISQTKWKEVSPGRENEEKKVNNDTSDPKPLENEKSAFEISVNSIQWVSKEQLTTSTSGLSTSTGTVEEVHSHVGRLKTPNGELHYFSSNQCFLYGICLEKVELWHVLVHGQSLNYSMGNGKVDSVWIGSKTMNKSKKSAEMISDWCKENSVPNSAKELLMSSVLEL